MRCLRVAHIDCTNADCSRSGKVSTATSVAVVIDQENDEPRCFISQDEP